MRKLNATLFLGIAVALLGFALVLTYGRTVERRIADGRETIEVLVAAADIPQGTQASSLREGSSLELTEVPKAYAPADALTRLDDVEGKVLLGPVPKGAQLSRSLFGSPSAAAAVTPSANGIALAVEVGLSPGVARYLSVGSTVDVFVTYKQAGGADAASRTNAPAAQDRTKLFLSGAKVLAVSVAERPAVEADKKGRATTTSAEDSGKVVVVLDLVPQDAERVVNAVTIGELYLGLSNPDARHTTPSGVVPDDVVGANR
jgi:pilus assembly protein CpaB